MRGSGVARAQLYLPSTSRENLFLDQDGALRALPIPLRETAPTRHRRLYM
jgi:hypothetical protein